MNSPVDATTAISDDLLLNRYARQHSPEPFLELVRRHTGLVYGTCLRITSNVHDAEELTQECFFDLSRRASGIRTSLVGWLHQAATHRALNRIRGEKRRRTHEQAAGIELQITSPVSEQGEQELTWKEVAPLVDQALAELPEEVRTPVLMCYLEGASQGEVAQLLGVHQSTISRRLEQGLESLRDSLRRLGLVVSVAALVSWLTAETAVAAPPTLTASLGKIAVVGVGSSLAASAWASFFVALWAFFKKSMAMLFVPTIAGILWGEVVALLVLVAWSCYLGFRRPDWFRIVTATRQVPNVYEQPFFMWSRWTWKVPPQNWRIFVAGNCLWAFLILGWIAAVSQYLKIRGLLFPGGLFFPTLALWNFLSGMRIWHRVRRCRVEFPECAHETAPPVPGGAPFLFGGMSNVLILIELWLYPQGRTGTEPVWVPFAVAAPWAVLLIAGVIVAIRGYPNWKLRLNDHSLMRLSISLIFLLTFACLFTYVSLIAETISVYVPWGEADPLAVAKSRNVWLSSMALLAAVGTLFVLTKFYRRLSNLLWGVAMGVVVMIVLLDLKLFTEALFMKPVLAAPPRFASRPLMPLLPGHFILWSSHNLLANPSLDREIAYAGGISSTEVRVTAPATISLEYENQQSQIRLPSSKDGRELEIMLHIILAPQSFKQGIPGAIQVTLVVAHYSHLADRWISENVKIEVPVETDISPEDWKKQKAFDKRELEEQYLLGKTLTLGTVAGQPITLKVVSAP